LQKSFGTQTPTPDQFARQFSRDAKAVGGVTLKPVDLSVDRGDWRFMSRFGLAYPDRR
jgi:hypothetical protein